MAILRFAIFVLFTSFTSAVAKQDFLKEMHAINANIVFVRHALAPGYGDPINFDINDCETQRNLNIQGIKQSRNLGNYFKKQTIIFSDIFTSQWCRCIDTAKEMGLENWLAIPELNSFYQNRFKKSDIMEKLNYRLNSVKEEELLLMITHQVVISEVTKISPPSGGIVIYNHKTKKALTIDLK